MLLQERWGDTSPKEGGKKKNSLSLGGRRQEEDPIVNCLKIQHITREVEDVYTSKRLVIFFLLLSLKSPHRALSPRIERVDT